MPLATTRWSYSERWWTERYTPGWAIVLGVAFGLTLLGLLFFMVTAIRPRGSMTIHMQSAAALGWNQPRSVDTIAHRRLTTTVATLSARDHIARPLATHSSQAVDRE